MSPEYAMFGQFSEKSDVYSFGVMVLEIVTGKKNLGSYDSHHIYDGLLNYVSIIIYNYFFALMLICHISNGLLLQVWRQWKDQTPSCILDPNIKEKYSDIEVLKCIRIGLLCVQQNPDTRPTMVTIVSYLNSDVIELPTPREPAFFLHERMESMDATTIAQESTSYHSMKSSIPNSTNEMSLSEIFAGN